MAASFQILKAFAPLLRYPSERFPQQVESALLLCAHEPQARGYLEQLKNFVAAHDSWALEEDYTRTFDINPAVAMDVGFQLFGLAYKRGEFLVKMQGALRRVGMDAGTELADHLPTLLELCAALPADEGLQLMEECLAPAIKKMLEGVPKDAKGLATAALALGEYVAANYRCLGEANPDLQDEAHDITEGYEYSPGDLDDLRLGVNRHE
ncbi:MAG: molecular chaperone TorD family protein [Planctomycetes bacterium]|nr:molecular chaperone TorD family protein [Planctomycetota bacterium]